MPPIDPKLVKKIIEAVAKIVEEIKDKHLISKIVLASAVVVSLLFFPIYVISHPLEALSIARGDSEVTEEYLGYIAGKYETGTSDPAFISSGEGDYGGVSYGIPQFPSRGGMVKSFTNWLAEQDEELGSLFNGLTQNTTAFNDAWKKAAEISKSKFAGFQLTYSHQIDVKPLVEKCLSQLDIDFNRSRCLQELIISTGQQYGPNTSVIRKSGVTSDMDDETIIKKIYAYKRTTVGSYFSGSSGGVQSSLRNHRFVDEEKDLLAIVGQPPLGIIGEEEGGISTGYNLPRDPGYGALKKFLMAWTIDSDGNITEKKDIEESVALSGEPYNGTDVPLYLQGSYGNYSYGTGTIATSGCGPTSMAMVATLLTKTVVSPVDTAKWSEQHGYKVSEGTAWAFFPSYSSAIGISCDVVSNTSSNIVNCLKAGKIMILSMNPGHFTKSGHFIVLRGITSDGKILVNDPASTERTNQTWDVGTVASESAQAWAFSN